MFFTGNPVSESCFIRNFKSIYISYYATPFHNMRCDICGEHFKIHGLQSHFLQTTNPRCQEHGRRLQAARLAQIADSNSEMDIDQMDPNPPPPFDGDIFGDNYGPDDFNYRSDNNESDSQSELGSDLDSEGNADYKHGWEQEPPPLAPSPEPEEDQDNAAIIGHQRRAAADRIMNCTPHIEHFDDTRGRRAGAPLGNYRELSSQERYKSTFNSTNIYALFVSELDWKIAQWAKLQDPSSTAFSELLCIPGVLCFIICFIDIQNLIVLIIIGS